MVVVLLIGVFKVHLCCIMSSVSVSFPFCMVYVCVHVCTACMHPCPSIHESVHA